MGELAGGEEDGDEEERQPAERGRFHGMTKCRMAGFVEDVVFFLWGISATVIDRRYMEGLLRYPDASRRG
jgi:hypothetical protein